MSTQNCHACFGKLRIVGRNRQCLQHIRRRLNKIMRHKMVTKMFPKNKVGEQILNELLK